MADDEEIIGTKLEQAEETRRLYGASDGEPTVVIEIPTHPISVTQSRVVITKSDTAGSWLVWGVGSWGSYVWTDVAGSPQMLQVVNYNDTWDEIFQVDRFNESGSTSAEWNNNGSLVFPTGSEVMETSHIFGEPERLATEVSIISESNLGSFTFDIMANESGSWMTIPENELTILDGSGSNLRLKVGSPIGTGLRFRYKFNDDTADSQQKLNAIGSRISPIPHVWWKFNERDFDLGSEIIDSSGSDFTGSGYNVLTDQVGKKYRCYKFDGLTSYAVSDSDMDSITGSMPRTIMAWIKTDYDSGSINQDIVSWGNSNDSGSQMRIRIDETGSFRTQVDGGNIVGTTKVNTNEWMHVAYVQPSGGSDISQGLLYVNGSLDSIIASSSEIMDTASGSPLAVGINIDDASPDYFDGYIDDVRVYGEDLDLSQMQEIYDNVLNNEFPLETELTYMVDDTLGSVGVFTGIDYVMLSGSDFNWREASYACWFKVETSGLDSVGRLINNYRNTADAWGIMISGTGSLEIYDDINGADDVFYPTAIEADQWYHTVATIDSLGSQTLYLNGSLIGSGSVTTGGGLDQIGSSNIFIGERGRHFEVDTIQHGFIGSMSDVRFYQKILSLSEAGSLYNNGSAYDLDITPSIIGSASLNSISVRYTVVPPLPAFIVDNLGSYLIDHYGNFIIETS